MNDSVNIVEYITRNADDFLRYLKSKFPLYHDSNVFLRDLHYGLMEYVEERLRKKLNYLVAERLTSDVVKEFEKKGIFRKIDGKTWLLQYKEFALPRPAPAVKPVAAQPAAVPQPATQ